MKFWYALLCEEQIRVRIKVGSGLAVADSNSRIRENFVAVSICIMLRCIYKMNTTLLVQK